MAASRGSLGVSGHTGGAASAVSTRPDPGYPARASLRSGELRVSARDVLLGEIGGTPSAGTARSSTDDRERARVRELIQRVLHAPGHELIRLVGVGIGAESIAGRTSTVILAYPLAVRATPSAR